MRNLNPIQTRGYFWLPHNPDEEMPGELRISNDGQIELELIGVFTNPESEVAGLIADIFSHLDEVDRICGRVLEGSYVTLLNCLRTRIQSRLVSRHPVSSSSFVATFALVGVNLEEDEAVFGELNFITEGLNDWLNFDVIEQSIEVQTVDETVKSVVGGTVNYYTKESPSFSLDEGIEIQFHSPVNPSPIRHPVKSLSLKSQPYISLVSDKPKKIEDFIDLADKIRKFISLAVDQEAQFQSFTFLGDNLGQIAPVQMYFQTRASRKPGYKPGIMKTLFTLPDIENSFESIMNTWIRQYERDNAGHALSLYFSGAWKETEFLDTNTLFLAQSIEVLHRKTLPQNKPMSQEAFKKATDDFFDSTSECLPDLIKTKIRFANEPSLRDRVEEMMMMFEGWFRDGEQSGDFAKRVSNTRNYFTHYSSRLSKKHQDSEQLVNLHTKLEILLLLYILRLIGFTDYQMSLMIGCSQRLERILDPPCAQRESNEK